MADREELHELHVHQRRPRAERERVAFARHVVRGARPGVELGESAGCDHRCPGGDADPRAVGEREAECPAHRAVLHHQVGDCDVAECADAGGPSHLLAQCPGHRRAGVQEIDVAAAPAAVARRHDLADVAGVTGTARARPPDPPAVHLAHPLGRGPAQHLRERFVAEPAARLEGVGEVVFPGVGLLLGKGGGDGHLRHDRRAPAADHVLVGEDDPGAGARRGDGRVHAGAAGADDEHVGGEVHCVLFRPGSPGDRGGGGSPVRRLRAGGFRQGNAGEAPALSGGPAHGLPELRSYRRSARTVALARERITAPSPLGGATSVAVPRVARGMTAHHS